MVKPTCIPSSSTSSPTDHQENPSGTWNKYKGVRKRKWGKWVSEIRLPNSRERIWLGSYDSAEKAARAFDAALYCLRGRDAKFNFPENPPEISRGRELNPQEIQAVAARFANEMAEVAKNNNIDDNVNSNLNESHSPNINNAVGIEQSYTSTSSVSVSMSVSNGTPAMQQTESEMMNWSSFLSMLDINPGLSNYDFYPELDHQLYPPPVDTGDDNVVDDENGDQGYTSQSSFLWNF